MHNECALMLDDLPIPHMASEFRTTLPVEFRTDMCVSMLVEGASMIAYNNGKILILVPYKCN